MTADFVVAPANNSVVEAEVYFSFPTPQIGTEIGLTVEVMDMQTGMTEVFSEAGVASFVFRGRPNNYPNGEYAIRYHAIDFSWILNPAFGSGAWDLTGSNKVGIFNDWYYLSGGWADANADYYHEHYMGNVSMATSPWYYITLDNQAPVVENIETAVTYTATTNSMDFAVTATDVSGVASLWVYVSDDGSSFDLYPASLTAGEWIKNDIPVDVGTIYFYVKATDTNGYETVSPVASVEVTGYVETSVVVSTVVPATETCPTYVTIPGSTPGFGLIVVFGAIGAVVGVAVLFSRKRR
jgi:hypothetical protein